MFGLGKKEEPKLVGARQKLEQAKKYGTGFHVKSKREGKEPNPRLAIIIVWGMALGLATLLTESHLKKGDALMSTGNAGFDKLMFGSTTPSFIGSPDIDYIILLLIRGTFVFAVAGILPALTLAWQRLLDKNQMNVYIAFWGVTVGVALLYYISKDFLGSVFTDLLSVFM
ncbi:MAG: hypothetical protein RBS08_01220 [Bdellovibrionales bacterium]|jgi:hypothetical protein|nr:hypothetical protein [Bdellovibrionales bacterium]